MLVPRGARPVEFVGRRELGIGRWQEVLLARELHGAAHTVLRTWTKELTGGITKEIDWSKVSAREARDLAAKIFDAANVPQAARERYSQAFHECIYADILNRL